MNIQEFREVTIITSDPDKYLVLKDIESSEQLIGRPKRIILDNTGVIPEFEEREVTE